MQQIGVIIELIVPDSMTPNKVIEEVKTSIGFGKPVVTLQYVLPDAPDVPAAELPASNKETDVSRFTAQ